MFTYKPQPVDTVHQLLKKSTNYYQMASLSKDVSFGMAIQRSNSVETLRLATLPEEGDLLSLAQLTLPNKRMMAHVRLECGPGETCVKNTHPFYKQSRYLFMHNGFIPYFNSSTINKTDSEQFMDAWLSIASKGYALDDSLFKLIKVVDHPQLLLNLVMVDLQSDEALIYSHTPHNHSLNIGFPPLHWHSRLGIVTNFVIGGSRPIEGLVHL